MKIAYFGYGANSREEMMEAIIGRKPDGFLAVLENYELCIQKWEDVPEKVKQSLTKWDPDFRTYCIRPGSGRVSGIVWLLTKEEHNFIKNWENHGIWYKPIVIEIKHKAGTLKAHTEIIEDKKLERIDGENYPAFLNKREKMFEVARLERKLWQK